MPSRSTRDVGLAKIARSTRLLTVGSFAAAGVLSLLVAHAHPGKSAHKAASSEPSGSASTPASGTGSTGAGSTGAGSAGTGSAGPASTANGSSGLNAPLTTPSTLPSNAFSPPVISSGAS